MLFVHIFFMKRINRAYVKSEARKAPKYGTGACRRFALSEIRIRSVLYVFIVSSIQSSLPSQVHLQNAPDGLHKMHAV